MSGIVVGKRYAKALLKIAAENNEVDKLGEDLANLAKACGESDQLRAVLDDPKISRPQKVQIVGEIGKKLGLGHTALKFGKLLVSKGRAGIVGDILFVYQNMSNDLQGRADAEIRVTEKIGDAQKSKLEADLSSFSGKKITLTVVEDPSILGGVITKIGSLVLDGSVKNRLDLIRESISRG